MADLGTGAPAIVARGLGKRFGKVVALEGLDLEVARGSVFGLLGPRGAGKTTAIRLLAGLARPTSGSVEVAGVRVSLGGVDFRRRVGVLTQDPAFYGWMTGRDLLAFVADLVGVPRAEIGDRVASTLERVGLEGDGNRRIDSYDAAMRQRLGIGQALIGAPEVLILDEPVASLEPDGRRELLELIGRLREAATVLLTTPSVADVELACDRVALLAGGRLVLEATTENLLGNVAPPAYVIEVDHTSGLALAGLVARLGSEPWVRDAIADGHVLRVAVTDDGRAAHELLPTVVAAGVPIGSFRRERPSLEEIVRIAGDGAGAQQPASEAPQ
jgi:ABC-2 type transport system ATP-binding protein